MAGFSQLWTEELTEAQTEALVEKMASEICRRKLQGPAILMLEMNKPLAPVLAQAAVIASPFAIPFVGFDNFNDYSRLMAKRENVERLLVKIEELSRGPGDDAEGAKDN
ncbi:hypothetical protein [Fimbriimonas ginsengisoli]|uniref:Uncharacterized protein n=1 Tax=Fimbriimonas ginsengisoli Gsoil 348 TaxID=661478 RepID=A0A068NZ66_FIMGI|nr:hypothetical protein [Fimbriimonas ginsengisoli]AIE88039.1 hypothetical protein OP10G_4671 [Fimbriimonas ginsengisoli Gsoil 348]